MRRSIMQVSVISDLHFDVNPKPLVLSAEADTLIIAGDMCEVEYIDHVRRDKRINNCVKWLTEESQKYKNVIMVAGNHEHYRSVFENTITIMREKLPSNFHILDNSSVTIDNVVFIGGTLWTNLRNNDPMCVLYADGAMSDFQNIRRLSGDRFRAEETVTEFNKTILYLEEEIARVDTEAKKICVVTHHAPSYRSIAPRFSTSLLNAAFYSDLDTFIESHPNIALWCHGHSHAAFDYMIENTRIICNPRGYGHEITGFDPGLLISL